ncbi:MAG TPA: DUF998 domain-containing protein [Marmoricola sp.]|nr:DUF998 domain-containing protein [Marmoricola sp.]
MSVPAVSTRALAGTTLVAVGLFPLIVLALNLVQRSDGYSPVRNAVSELALGRDGGLMAVAFCSLAVGTLAFAALLHRTSSTAGFRTSLLALAGMLTFVSAGVHTDRTGAPATTHGDIHNAAGIITFVAMLVAMGVSAWRFRGEPRWRGLALPTTALTAAGVVAFFLIPVLGDARFGVGQRLLIGSFVCWLLTGAAHQLRVTSGQASAPGLRRARAV